MKIICTVLALAMLVVAIPACTYLTPYKIEIQQGHVLDDAELAKLKRGMSRNQVAQVLGTPLLTDVFHGERWDYIHYVRKRGRMTAQKKLTLIFAEDKLARLEGDGAPPLAPPEAQHDGQQGAPSVAREPGAPAKPAAPEPPRQ
jgi:outer membrane protein assembly factor BamE